MAQAGMSMESHTRDHPGLDGRDYDFLVYQLLGAQESLEHYTGKQPHMFCYPSGHYDDLVLTVLRTMPVWRAVTTQPGAFHTTDNRLEMPRLRITNDTGVLGLAMLLETSR
jgi:peptidoglycan/xylan/chitin deacetylase (PgdA/CDA1 family)